MVSAPHYPALGRSNAPVLVVEDNPEDFVALSRALRKHGVPTPVVPCQFLINRLVEGCGGHIEVDSQPGHGTTFRV